MDIETEKIIEESSDESPSFEENNLQYVAKRNYWEFGIFVAVVLILLAVVGVLGFLVFKTFSDPNEGKASIQEITKENNQVAVPKEAEKKSEEVVKPSENSAAPSKEINPAEVSIKILNGGAPGGSAGKVKELLLTKGYKKVEVGNSDKSNYSGVTVFYQAEEKEAADKVVTDLKAKYPAAQAKMGVSVEEKSSSVVVILGK